MSLNPPPLTNSTRNPTGSLTTPAIGLTMPLLASGVILATQLVRVQDYTVLEAIEVMNVGKSTMDKWVLQLKSERKGITPKAGPT